MCGWSHLAVLTFYFIFGVNIRSENDIFICDRMGDIAEDETTFYSNAEGYWRDIPPTVDGMLGGYGSISSIDISGSKAFLLKLIGVREL